MGTTWGASNVGVFPVGLATEITANAPAGIPLYVRVIASNAVASSVSNEVIVFDGGPAPPGPPSLSPPGVLGNTVAPSWNVPTSGAPPDYYVVVGRYLGNPTILATFFTTQLMVTVPGVPQGNYVATVVAVNAGGLSAESNAVLVSVR